MGKVVTLSKAERLVGTWKSCDGFSSVELTIRLDGNELTVFVIDRDDEETAEIQDVVWDERTSELGFSTYWQSSGRLTKYRVAPCPARGRANVTYTYTAQETWEQIEPQSAPR